MNQAFLHNEEAHFEAAREKGILEQSEITLVSLADTTLQDHDTTEEDPHPGGGRRKASPQRGVTEVQQQRLRALQQRSSLRVEEIKARRALAKVKPEIQVGGPRLDLEDEVKDVTPEQRKREASVMHSRTQRLYEQLEEVKHQKALRNRQEAYAKTD
ncbi:hypothetical protein F7725_020177 [Dissostichus mawsoni]|uniref:Uncharacterized protein n=1 Tax=Dissostichus mawsoni TaxID=36200 RepID=A0A7J5YEF6_DISMA|nr:hypothetical protein F7725_020177 [Dissostichus mawsoni]